MVSASSASLASRRVAKTGALSSWRSRSYASGRPLTVARESREPSDGSAGFPSRELCDIGIQLLRHHRRAGRGGLRKADEAELRGRPEDDLLADPREVREEHRGGVKVVEGEVAIRDGIDRVARGGVAEGLECRAGERASSERAFGSGLRRGGETGTVAVEHLHPGEQVVTESPGCARCMCV